MRYRPLESVSSPSVLTTTTSLIPDRPSVALTLSPSPLDSACIAPASARPGGDPAFVQQLVSRHSHTAIDVSTVNGDPSASIAAAAIHNKRLHGSCGVLGRHVMQLRVSRHGDNAIETVAPLARIPDRAPKGPMP